MTRPMDNDELGHRLATLTRQTPSPAALWSRAAPAMPVRGVSLLLKRRLPAPWLTAAASLLIVFVLAAVILPELGNVRSISVSLPAPTASPTASMEGKGLSLELLGRDSDGFSPYAEAAEAGFPVATGRLRMSFSELKPASPTPQDLPRQVIRKATLELTTPDVRAAMLKASMLLNLATGEFTENSSLTGEGPTAHATLTLRVAAARLSEVLNQLRVLGKVTSEQATGDDVTDQVVDIDARLRNEQRVEAELLDLLSNRNDAPLDDILAVRNQLSNIRESIERLTAQRDRLSHLVSLATVLVVIRADGAPAAPAAAGIWDYFKDSVASAWRSGLGTLADTAAALVRIAIGGLIWWALFLIGLGAAVHFHRRWRAHATQEPAPTE